MTDICPCGYSLYEKKGKKMIMTAKRNFEQTKDLDDCLYCYYNHDVYGYDDIDDVPEEAVAEELKLPLEQRESGILRKVAELCKDISQLNPPGEDQPLMRSVGNLDYYMTEYLLEHGANPHFDIQEGDIPFGCGNYYIDEMDLIAMEEGFATDCDQTVFDRILKIAQLFAKHGVTNVRTYCITIDSETKTVQVAQAKTKF